MPGNRPPKIRHRSNTSGASGESQHVSPKELPRSGEVEVLGILCSSFREILFLGSCLAIISGNGFTQDAPKPDTQTPVAADENKEGKKDDIPNPAQVVVDKTKDATMQALVKARDWETGWVAGAYVGKNRKLVELTTRQREDIYLRQTFTTPSAYLKRMFAAGIDQARGSPSQWQGGWGGYGERFASREGQFIASSSLAALGNAALKYEVRYDQCRCSGFGQRTRHAILRNFLTYNHTEQELRPQWALYGGAFGGGLISSTWKPQPRNAFAEGGRAVLGQAAWGTLLNVFTEFAHDINRKLGSKR